MAEGDVLEHHQEDKRLNNPNQVIENGVEEEPSFSDPEDFIDDVSDKGEFLPAGVVISFLVDLFFYYRTPRRHSKYQT